MDKDVCKQLLRQADLPVAPWVCVRSGEKHPNYAQLSSQLGKRLFVKAANMGSSVAIYYVNDQASFDDAMGRVFHYDDKALIEQAVDMVREVECAVLIGKGATASMAGEVIVKDGFYDYDAKYIHTERTQFNVPADLPADMHDRISALAIKAVLATECRGMARVDCFLTGDDQVIIGEINTIPGFTAISLYPQLWQLMGKPPALLMHELIAEAISRHQHKQSLQREPEVQAALNC